MRIKLILSYLFLIMIRLYRVVFSPFVGQHCRFFPTCSCYAEEAINIHGPFKGCILTTRRLLRCHPWANAGYDPVPKKNHSQLHSRKKN